jgi:hypothetical protein
VVRVIGRGRKVGKRKKKRSSKAKPVTGVIQHNRETWSMRKSLAPVPDIMV